MNPIGVLQFHINGLLNTADANETFQCTPFACKNIARDLANVRDALAELLTAARADVAEPTSITLDHRDIKPGEEPGPKWWAAKRRELEARGYVGGYENSDLTETFYRGGPSPRLERALTLFEEAPESLSPTRVSIMRGALEAIANHSANLTGAPAMVKIAADALKACEE